MSTPNQDKIVRDLMDSILSMDVTPEDDNLAIAVCLYFQDSSYCEDYDEQDEGGWPPSVTKKYEEFEERLKDAIRLCVEENTLTESAS